MVRETVAGNAVVSSMRQQPVYTGYSVGAAEHAWRPSPSPAPLPLPVGERKGELGAGEKECWKPLTKWSHRYGTCPRLRQQPVYTGYSVGAAEHAWRPSPSPCPLLLLHGERKGERWGGRERMLETPHEMVAQIWYVPNEKYGFLIRL